MDNSSNALKAMPLNVVHLWAAPLEIAAAEREALAQTLSVEELDRASRFHFEVHRNRYIAAHGWLRLVLGYYLSLAPAQLLFEHSPRGKPALSGPNELQFNMAHSEDLALIGVGRTLQLGVDLEFVRSLSDMEELVARFFSKRESAAFRLLPEGQKARAFFNLWTRKEAWLKATGEGITHLLDQVEVSFLPGERACLLQLPAAYAAGAAWCLYDIAVRPGFAAALAVPGPIVPQLRWTSELIGVGL